MKYPVKILIKAIRDTVGGYPRTGVEVGVWEGKISEVLLKTFRRLHLTMVDEWLPGDTGRTSRSERQIMNAMHLAHDRTNWAVKRRTIIRASSLDAAQLISDGSQSFVFINSSYLYEDVMADSEAYWPKVRSDLGMMLWYNYGGVSDRRGKWGVKVAVDEFTQRNGLEVFREHIIAWAVKREEV